jgi:hypothetical protein
MTNRGNVMCQRLSHHEGGPICCVPSPWFARGSTASPSLKAPENQHAERFWPRGDNNVKSTPSIADSMRSERRRKVSNDGIDVVREL